MLGSLLQPLIVLISCVKCRQNPLILINHYLMAIGQLPAPLCSMLFVVGNVFYKYEYFLLL